METGSRLTSSAITVNVKHYLLFNNIMKRTKGMPKKGKRLIKKRMRGVVRKLIRKRKAAR